MSEDTIPCPYCSNVMVEWLEGKHPSGEVKRGELDANNVGDGSG